MLVRPEPLDQQAQPEQLALQDRQDMQVQQVQLDKPVTLEQPE